jgi:septum formation protein
MLHLASQSPRRRQLLDQLGITYRVLDVGIAEVVGHAEAPEAYVRRVACEKARAGLRALGSPADAVVLGADTEVMLDGEVFGKPADAESARAMLLRLSARTHTVLSAVCCMDATRESCVLSSTDVQFTMLDDATLMAYLASGEWQGKAGAYAIQGRAGAFIAHIAGSYTGVMGLPLYETASLLAGFGIRPAS